MISYRGCSCYLGKNLLVFTAFLGVCQTSYSQSSPRPLTLAPLASVEDGGSMVYTIAYSPDGRWLASSGRSKVIQMRRSHDLKILKTMEGHKGGVTQVAYLPDGQSLVSASGDGSVRIWSVTSGQELKVYGDHQGLVTGLAIFPDGGRLVSGDADKLAGEVLLRNLKTGMGRPVLPSYHAAINSLQLVRAGQTLVTASFDGTVRFWDLETGTEQAKFTWHNFKPVVAALLSPDEKTIVSSGSDLTVAIHDIASSNEIRRIALKGKWVARLAFSPTGSVLAMTDGNKVQLLETEKFTEVGSVTIPNRNCNALTFAPDGKTLAVGGDQGFIQTFSIER